MIIEGWEDRVAAAQLMGASGYSTMVVKANLRLGRTGPNQPEPRADSEPLPGPAPFRSANPIQIRVKCIKCEHEVHFETFEQRRRFVASTCWNTEKNLCPVCDPVVW